MNKSHSEDISISIRSKFVCKIVLVDFGVIKSFMKVINERYCRCFLGVFGLLSPKTAWEKRKSPGGRKIISLVNIARYN